MKKFKVTYKGIVYVVDSANADGAARFIRDLQPNDITRDLIIKNDGHLTRNGITIELSSLYNRKTGAYDGGWGNSYAVFGYDVGCPGKEGFRSIETAVAYAKKYGMFK